MKYRFINIYNFGLIACLALLFGCNRQTEINTGQVNMGQGTAWGTGSFETNGERIYFTATSNSGDPITYSGGPETGMMMTGGMYACVSCHGTDARGGRHMMHMQVMNAPDIRWSSLAEGHHHEEGENEETTESNNETHDGELSEHHEQYTFKDFKNALEKGKHPDGDELSSDMPRWHMSDRDLKDLMDYLQSLR